ncbi:MAG: hypothetical protein ABDH21_03890 [bacterium]
MNKSIIQSYKQILKELQQKDLQDSKAKQIKQTLQKDISKIKEIIQQTLENKKKHESIPHLTPVQKRIIQTIYQSVLEIHNKYIEIANEILNYLQTPLSEELKYQKLEEIERKINE